MSRSRQEGGPLFDDTDTLLEAIQDSHPRYYEMHLMYWRTYCEHHDITSLARDPDGMTMGDLGHLFAPFSAQTERAKRVLDEFGFLHPIAGMWARFLKHPVAKWWKRVPFIEEPEVQPWAWDGPAAQIAFHFLNG